eukprot:8947302-Pyramimonas_sp.AAC.1
MEKFQEQVCMKGKSDKLMKACSTYDPKGDETAQHVTIALTGSEGARVGSGEVVAKLIGCARTCFGHAVQMGLDVAAASGARWPESADQMKKAQAAAAGALNRPQ